MKELIYLNDFETFLHERCLYEKIENCPTAGEYTLCRVRKLGIACSTGRIIYWQVLGTEVSLPADTTVESVEVGIIKP